MKKIRRTILLWFNAFPIEDIPPSIRHRLYKYWNITKNKTMKNTKNKLMNFLGGEWRGELGEIAPKNEPQGGSCTCSDCENSVRCEHSEQDLHIVVKGCSSCAR